MFYKASDISNEVGVSLPTVLKKMKNLNITKDEINDEAKARIIEACQDTIERKNEAERFMSDVQNAEIGQCETIAEQTGSTLEQRLWIAKKEFDNVNKSLAECQVAIEQKGTILMNGNNGTISSNPAVKTKCDLLKQHTALQKTITELENALRYTITNKVNVIDDE